MSIAVSATYKSISKGGDTGVSYAIAVFTITGLSQTSDNAVSLTSNGTSTGTPLLGNPNYIVGVPKYVATADGNWYEKAVPSIDSAGNGVLNIHVDSSGPTSFRVEVMYGNPST